AAGTYNVALTVTTSVGTSTEQKAGYVTVTGAEGEGEGEGEEELPVVLQRSFPGGDSYTPGATRDITVTMQHAGTNPVTAIGLRERLPQGWTFDRLVSGAQPVSVVPQSPDGSTEFLWLSVPAFPFTFTYR